LANTIFFAWQLDTKSENNKTFIWESIVSACKKCEDTATPELSPRPEKDMEGVSGSPNIVQTIFKKIDQCSIFIADVTLVGETIANKSIPNPNVLIELGYAAKTIGWERTILVINNAYGKANDLPFDILQHRWPIEYRVTDDTKVRGKMQGDLEGILIDAIRGCEESSLIRAKNMAMSLDTDTLALIAKNENKPIIELPMPAKTAGEHLTSSLHISSIRRLIDLGAIKFVSAPDVGYGWTYDGLKMIKEVHKLHPQLLSLFRGDFD
jgi:hypothetical protein